MTKVMQEHTMLVDRRFSAVLGFAILLLFLCGPTLGQTAGMLSFQGLLKDSSGVPISESVALQFRIFTAESGGTLVDMDGDGTIENTVGQDVKEVAVTATNGVVSTKFGPVHPKAFDGTARWLQLTVDGSALPRIEMATAPATAEQLNRPGSGLSAIHVSSNGFVGMGTTVPEVPLEIKSTLGQTVVQVERTANEAAGPILRLQHSRGAGIPIQQYDSAAEIHFNLKDESGSSVLVSRIFSGLAISPTTSGSMTFQVQSSNGLASPLTLHPGGANVTVLHILGGSDLAEPFSVATEDPKPGSVVVIDSERPGGLIPATQPYDKKVAGIISGANGLSPGMIMKAEGKQYADGEHPVALTGRVWCWCDASFGPINTTTLSPWPKTST